MLDADPLRDVVDVAHDLRQGRVRVLAPVGPQVSHVKRHADDAV